MAAIIEMERYRASVIESAPAAPLSQPHSVGPSAATIPTTSTATPSALGTLIPDPSDVDPASLEPQAKKRKLGDDSIVNNSFITKLGNIGSLSTSTAFGIASSIAHNKLLNLQEEEEDMSEEAAAEERVEEVVEEEGSHTYTRLHQLPHPTMNKEQSLATLKNMMLYAGKVSDDYD